MYFISIAAFLVLIAVQIGLTVVDKERVVDSANINTIALLLGGLSIPGILVQLFSMVEINNKKTYTLTCKCPNCRQLVDMKMIED